MKKGVGPQKADPCPWTARPARPAQPLFLGMLRDGATGAFGAIAQSSTALAIVAITEPVAAGDIATISAALDNMRLEAGSAVCELRDRLATRQQKTDILQQAVIRGTRKEE